MAINTADTSALSTDEGVRRRDWIHIAALSTAGVGGASLLFPLISQMAPSEDVLAASSTDVDVGAIQPGQSIKTTFRKQPLFVKRLTADEIAKAKADDAADMRDPATLASRTKEGHEDILITMGVCTHLGCVPLGDAGDFGGWFCPCHGSHYDTAGRIRKGPAPRNLPVPVAAFTDETTIKLG